MARYPDSFIEELRDRADLLDVASRHMQLKKQGSNWLGLCPFHSEKTPSFSIRPDRGFYKCFGCGEGGNVYNFLMKIKGIGFVDAIEELASMTGIPLPTLAQETPQQSKQRQERQQLFDILEETQQWFRSQLNGSQGKSARDYLSSRGLSQTIIQHFGLGFAPAGWNNLINHFGGGKVAESLLEKAGLVTIKGDGRPAIDRFRKRIIFPIRDHKGRCIGFGGRIMGPEKPKYINSPETSLYHKGEVLYGLDQAQKAIQNEGWVMVVEGYMDLIALANHGIESVVATLGTALTEPHLRLLWRRTRRIHFCFDGDEAGRKAAWRALQQVLDGLQADRHADFLFLPTGQDPDSLVQQEGAQLFRRRVEQATSLTTLLIKQLSKELDTQSPEGRAALIHRARPLLAKIADPLLRELYAETIGQHIKVSMQQVLGDVVNTPLAFGDKPNNLSPKRYPSQTFQKQNIGKPSSAKPSSGTDFEQTLLAILLRNPTLVMEHEEELSQLELENHQLSQLLTELMELGHAHSEDTNTKILDQLSSAQMIHWAKEILSTEVGEPESVQAEFMGCLINCRSHHLKRQIDQTRKKIQTCTDDTPQYGVLMALLQEQKRLQHRKCLPVLS